MTTVSLENRLPAGWLAGPVKNKLIELSNRTPLRLQPWDAAGVCGKIHPEPLAEQKQTTQFSSISAIQPTLLQYRTAPSRRFAAPSPGRRPRAGTNNGGKWSRMRRTSLPNPNSRWHRVGRRPGTAVYNHTRNGRSPLNVSVSSNGKNGRVVLENVR